jgi:pyruvate dehydrogenase (quinone)
LTVRGCSSGPWAFLWAVSQRVADFVLGRLTEWGVHRIFGFPGDGINAFLGASDRAEGDPEFIQVRHEEMSAFMACSRAKFTGDLGVCIATSGPGAIHLLNGLYDAKLDHRPVLAIVGQQKRMSLGADYQQEVDLNTLFKDVSEYVQVCMQPAQARHSSSNEPPRFASSRAPKALFESMFGRHNQSIAPSRPTRATVRPSPMAA